MKKILIVLKDVILLSEIKRWHSRSHNEDMLLFFAKDSAKAFEIIQNESIDLLITELNLAKVDGIELIAKLAVQHPAMQLAVFLSIDSITLEDCQILKTFSSVYFLYTPYSLKEFIKIFYTLKIVIYQALTIADINIADFFKLIEFQKKTCLITVENLLTTQKALVYFENGTLYDAIHGILKWEDAILEIMSWTKTLIVFKPLNNKQFRRKIFTSLKDLIINLEQPKDKDDLDFLIENVLEKAEARIKLEARKEKGGDKAKIEVENTVVVDSTVEDIVETASIEMVADVEVIGDVIEASVAEEMTESAIVENIVETAVQVDEKAHAIIEHFSRLKLDKLLLPLQDMDGYLAFAMFDTNGNLFVQHKVAIDKIELPIKNIADLIKTLTTAVSNIKLGKSNFVQLNCNNGIFQAFWDLEYQFIVAVLLETDTKDSSLAKINLQKIYEKVQKQLNQ